MCVVQTAEQVANYVTMGPGGRFRQQNHHIQHMSPGNVFIPGLEAKQLQQLHYKDDGWHCHLVQQFPPFHHEPLISHHIIDGCYNKRTYWTHPHPQSIIN